MDSSLHFMISCWQVGISEFGTQLGVVDLCRAPVIVKIKWPSADFVGCFAPENKVLAS